MAQQRVGFGLEKDVAVAAFSGQISALVDSPSSSATLAPPSPPSCSSVVGPFGFLTRTVITSVERTPDGKSKMTGMPGVGVPVDFGPQVSLCCFGTLVRPQGVPSTSRAVLRIYL